MFEKFQEFMIEFQVVYIQIKLLKQFANSKLNFNLNSLIAD